MNIDTARNSLCLDGTWSLVLDPEDSGVRQHWFKALPAAQAVSVQVPSVWDRWVPDYDGVGWYFKTFTWSASRDGRHVDLHFEAADYAAEVWLNGIRLGDHEGGYTPFSFNATSALNDGENFLAVRIVDPYGEEGHGKIRPREIARGKKELYGSFAGIWGSVTLTDKPAACIRDIFIQPDLRRKLIHVQVEAASEGTVHLEIAGTPYRCDGAPGTLTLEFPEFDAWTPTSPILYTLLCRLVQADGSFDLVRTRFGMREFTVKEERFLLNQRPIFLKAVLLQPDYPRSLAAPDSEAMARRELELVKAAGFNMIRCHVRPATPLTLKLADELGLLVYEESAIGHIAKSHWMDERCEREVREMILRDRNHPSVVIWGIPGATGDAGNSIANDAHLIKDNLCALARSLDPTRLIIDASGVNATREPARLMRPHQDTLEPYDDLSLQQRAPVDTTIERYFQHNGDPDRLVFISSFGYGGPEDLEKSIELYGDARETSKDAQVLARMLEAAKQGFEDRNLDRIFESFSGFLAAARQVQCDAARHQIDALRANGKVAGYCYTQLADAGPEFCAGLLDRWRQPKAVLKTFQEGQTPTRPLIFAQRTNLHVREEVSVTILLANEDRLEGRADLSLQVVGPTQQVLWKKKRGVKIPKHGKELWTGTIGASGSPGMHRFVVRLMQGMKVLAQSSLDFYVYEPAPACEIAVHVLDPQGMWKEKCAGMAKKGDHRAPILIVPPLANTIRAYPEQELMEILGQVEGGAVAIVFSPPDDWNDLAERIDDGLRVTTKDAVGGLMPAVHYVKLHPIFESLPARCLMRQPYRNVVPRKTYLEPGEEEFCGAYNTAPIAQGGYTAGETPWWGNDILVLRYGSGRIVFTHLRILEFLREDPVADRLFVNLVGHFGRRSVPPETVQPLQARAIEWLRNERVQRIRRWMVVGEFPNFHNGAGHDTAYPPEKQIDTTATYPGWYKAISWRPWYASAEQDYLIDLQEACSPVFQDHPRDDYGVAYSYAEFTSDRREDIELQVGVQNAMKIWLNGLLLHESKDQVPEGQFRRETASGYVKQGRNTILVKCSKTPGPFRFSVDLVSAGRFPLQLKWWR